MHAVLFVFYIEEIMRRQKIVSNSGRSFEPVGVTRSGVPVESAPLIEDVLDRDIASAIYDSSLVGELFDEMGMSLLDFGGGEFGIAVPMLLEIPVRDLSKIVVDKESGKKLGVRGAARLKSRLNSVMKQEPYY